MSLPQIAGYELLDLIGGGSTGAVYRALGPGGKACAVKTFISMAINKRMLGQTLHQLQTMPAHRGLLPVTGYDMDRSPAFSVSPLIGVMTKDERGGKMWQTPTLDTLCGRITADEAWRHIYELADALAFAHKHGVAHGNVKCSNVLVVDDPEGAVRLTDFCQGYVGGVHHIDVAQHLLYLCPDQVARPEDFFTAAGPSFDVYGFGVVAYRLLTGQFPRGAEAWAQEVVQRQQRMAQGQRYEFNGAGLFAAVQTQPRITWPTPAPTPWEERRRAIIERALDFDSRNRWRDLREVAHEFETLEADYLLHESREQTTAERRKQAGKVWRLRAMVTGLTAALGLAVFYGISTQVRLNTANSTITQNLEVAKQEQETRDSKIDSLAKELKVTQDARDNSNDNLGTARTMVDMLVTQLLQLPMGNDMDVAFSKQQLSDAANYLRARLPDLEKDATLAPERARTYGNLGMIALRQRDSVEAVKYLDKARNELHALVAREPNSEHIHQYHRWLGRFDLRLANMRAARGDDATAMVLLKEATANLDPGLEANPKDRNARFEAAQAWLDYGSRCRAVGNYPESDRALQRVANVMDPQLLGGAYLPEENFMLARAELERGYALRDSGKYEEAAANLVSGVGKMADLVAGSAPRNQEQAIMLAEAYTELADLLGKHFSSKEATDAHFEAIKVLLELVRLEPDWREANYLLARNYGEVAQLDRNVGNRSEAMRKKQDALELIKKVLADDPENRQYLFQEAKLRGELAELTSDAGKPSDALGVIKDALEHMKNLVQQKPADQPVATNREWEIQLAIMHGIHGRIAEAAKQKETARTSFKTAQQLWEKLAEQDKENEIIKNGLDWVKNRLAKLK